MLREPKVAIVTAMGRSGYLAYCRNLCEALAEAGADVTLVTSREGEEASGAGFKLIRLLGGMKRTQGRPLRAVDYCASLPRTIRFLRESRFDVVHFQDSLLPHADAVFLRLVRAKGGPKTVLTAHDPDQDRIAKGKTAAFSIRRPALSSVYKACDRIVVMSVQAYAEMVGTFHLPPGKIAKVPHGNYASYARQPLPSKQASRSRLGIPQDARTVLFFGSIKPSKGLDHLIRAFALLLKRVPDAFLIIAGEPLNVDPAPYERLMRDLALEERALFRAAYVPPELVPEHFVAADVVALPYLRIYQSGVLHLAYTFGKPVVASNVGGLSEDVRMGKSGLLVPPGDENALARALGDLLQDPSLAAEMGEYAKALSEEKHSWEAIARDTLEIYRTLLGERTTEGHRATALRRRSSGARSG